MQTQSAVDKIRQRLSGIADIYNRLVLLVGHSRSGETTVLRALAEAEKVSVLQRWSGDFARAGKMFRNIQLAFDQGLVNNEFGRHVGQLALTPDGDLLSHGFEVSLHRVHAD
jgi:hypothetical protein